LRSRILLSMDGGSYVLYDTNVISTSYVVHCRASALSRQHSGYGHRTRYATHTGCQRRSVPMHSDRVSMHVIAHGVSHRHRPKVNVLVWRGSHSHAMAPGSSSTKQTWSKPYVELTCPWPERVDMDVLMAVCTAVVMGELSSMPPDEPIALWREHLTSSMTDAVLGVSGGDPVGAFWSCCGRPRRRLAKPIGFVHGRGPRPCTNRLRLRWPCC